MPDITASVARTDGAVLAVSSPEQSTPLQAAPCLLTVSDLAAFLNVGTDWVYANADNLGAWRLGNGPKARLRFELNEVRARLTTCHAGESSPEPQPRTARRKKVSCQVGHTAQGVPLLPIRGRSVPS